MAKTQFSKRQIFMAIFAVVVSFTGMEIYKYVKALERAADVPAFQTIGSPNAPVHIIEFVDYNCPYCRIAYPKIMEVLTLRDDIYYMARPIGALGDESTRLVKLTMAAGLQDKFWHMHEEFLRHKGPITDPFIKVIARKHKIDLEKVYEDAESKDVQDLLDGNNNAASVLGIRYTPALMINKTIYVPTGEDLTPQDIIKVIDGVTS